ncbi:MAG: hypothetical protein JKY18_12160 [Flavobacteriales bacterium]|nr:hypothetical protein [Flavobacteriales bacterium]PCH89331.1 MAG: hypothetical protein COB88_01490 [Flavobacteriales bacterium]
MKRLFYIAFAFCGILATNSSIAQCDSTASMCQNHLGTSYISDGQSYRALLVGTEVAEFHTTFFGGSVYRIAGCNGISDGNLVWSMYDMEGNLLYTNNDYRNSPYWDFEFVSSIDVTIEAQLSSLSDGSGCAVLMIGFKR